MQGAAGSVTVLQPTKTAMTFCDIDLGRWIDVPAIQIIFQRSLRPSNRLSSEPDRRSFARMSQSGIDFFYLSYSIVMAEG